MEPSLNILVTGCSTGIGRATALLLDARGHRVLAAVRRAEDAAALAGGASSRLRPLLLDVTDAGSVEAAVREAEALLGGAGLNALVNNAGRNLNAAWEYTDDAAALALLDVNLLGPHRVARRFLPLLRRTAGRGRTAKIVNVGSIGSLVGVPWEAFYHASKFGLLGLGESMAAELHGQGIRVVTVMPGGIRTPFIAKSRTWAEQAAAALPADAPDAYRRGLTRLGEMSGRVDRLGSPPERVARRIAALVAMREPPSRVLVGPDAHLLAILSRLLPRRAFGGLMRAAFAP